MATQTTGTLTTGCDFDAQTAKAVHGKKIILAVLDETCTNLLALAGQQGLSWSVEAENTETATKDGTGDWQVVTPGVKSWTASTDGLWMPDDDGRKTIIKALKSGDYLCVGMYEREEVTNGMKYVPIRKGLAIVSSDELEAPNDDNTTYAVEFTGSGPCWLREAAEDTEITAATITVTTTTDDGSDG